MAGYPTDYGHEVTRLDLELQHYPDLVLQLNDSCVTEYGGGIAHTK